ncbi:heat shock protein 67B2-like isoform X2 [Anoplophora glabripennis]|uniref:heat shock protein 67B2-like isoform X2 n=1 Tax=Anoplophora glabripennis TaxID=217634 RepID=UPI000C79311C|nr:heat shock protein 67B2-like isoform X2 [Anoplophora glabripennis]
MNRKLFSLCTFYKNYRFGAITRNNYKNVHSNINLKLKPPINYTRYSTHEHNIATYEEIREIGREKSKKVLLIDVREPEELLETGVLPSSINIPLGNLESVLRDMSNEEFLKKYGREKPNEHFPLIFSCKLGKRSATACEICQRLGFKNIKNYAGGWTGWSERNYADLNIHVTCDSIEENKDNERKSTLISDERYKTVSLKK